MYRNPKLHFNITCTKCNDPNISSLPWVFKVNGLPCYFYVTTLPANKISSYRRIWLNTGTFIWKKITTNKVYSEFRIISYTLKTLVVFYLTFSKQLFKPLSNGLPSTLMVLISVLLDLGVRVQYYHSTKI